MHQGQHLKPPSSNPHLVAPMWLMNLSNLGVEPSPTLKFITQVIMGATPQWSRFGPRLSEPPHLRVHLERHVTIPHFRNVSIFVDISPWWLPSTFLSPCLSWPLFGLIISRLTKPIHIVSLCFQHKRFYWMCFLFSPNALIWHLLQIPFIQPFFLCLQNPLWVLA